MIITLGHYFLLYLLKTGYTNIIFGHYFLLYLRMNFPRLEFVKLMPKDEQGEIYRSLQYGVDITRETKHYPVYRMTSYRTPRKPLISLPLFDAL